MNIILASGSPRRRDLLQSLNVNLSIRKPDVVECQLQGEAVGDYLKRNVELKSEDVQKRGDLEDHLDCLIAADTIVVRSKKVLEKPKDPADAVRMLQSLSGQEHEVKTGFCVRGLGNLSHINYFGLVTTQVTFKHLESDEIDAYVSSREPFDKAGAYGAQGLGAYMIKSINGSYSNVVGLPMAEVVDVLRQKFAANITARLI